MSRVIWQTKKLIIWSCTATKLRYIYLSVVEYVKNGKNGLVLRDEGNPDPRNEGAEMLEPGLEG